MRVCKAPAYVYYVFKPKTMKIIFFCLLQCLLTLHHLPLFSFTMSASWSSSSSARNTYAQLGSQFVEAYYSRLTSDPATLYTLYVRQKCKCNSHQYSMCVCCALAAAC